MARVRLTVAAKVFITAVILGVVGLTFYLNPGLVGKIAPEAPHASANVPPAVALPDDSVGGPAAPPGGNVAIPRLAAATPGCATLPEVRFYHWAWNAQMGLMAATGGKQAAPGSLMCKNGVNLKLIREDNTDNMQALMVTLAEGLKAGEANPVKGAHFVAIMGDGSATFLKGLNDKLTKLGPDYVAQVVGSAGYSRGEDKFMGPPAWKQNPQAARGGLVAGVLRDGDWNIALKWLGDNKIPNNPDETTYDPDALNWVNASDYIDAAQKYVSGFCAELKNVKTGKKEKRCVDGVVTWTPGDVTVAEKKGGLVSIVSTREYRSQMPNAIIGNKKWMQANRKLVTGMLGAIFEAGDAIKASDDKLKEAAAVSAFVYGEQDPAYWYKYYRVQNQKDKQGLAVELGGSSVNNLADNLQLFGLTPGSANLFAATYTVFGNLVKSQYPSLLPSFYPVEQVLDTSYVKELSEKSKPTTAADVAVFKPEEKVERVVSRRAWNIEFVSGKATFTPAALTQLEALFSELVVASGTIVEVHGHTDDQGNPEANQKLSEARAFAVKEWLEKKSSTNFSEGRVRVFAHGQTQPVAPNSTPEGKAKNRRVEIVLGTSSLRPMAPRAGLAEAFRPNRALSPLTALALAGGWAAALLLAWVASPFESLPKPAEVLRALNALWWEHGMGPEMFTTLSLIAHATLYTVLISLALSYLSVLPFFRPLVAAASKLRFLGLTGLVFPFTLAFGGGHSLKVALLTFGMASFFVTSMAQIVVEIPRSEFDHMRVLGASELRIVWEVVVRGTLDRALDVLRQNVAIGWAMITMVEGISRAEGGIGALILNQNKHFHLAEVYAILTVILLLGLLLDYALGALTNVLCPYARLGRVQR